MCMTGVEVVGQVLDDVIPILRANLQPDKDAEVRSKFLTLLSRLILDADSTLNPEHRSASSTSSNLLSSTYTQLQTLILLTCSDSVCTLKHWTTMSYLCLLALCGLRGCKNRPAPFPGRLSYKAVVPDLSVIS